MTPLIDWFENTLCTFSVLFLEHSALVNTAVTGLSLILLVYCFIDTQNHFKYCATHSM